MPEISTPADDDAVVTPPAPDAADNGTTPPAGDNPDASKSDDTTVVTDDDKSKETTTKTDDTPATQFDDDLDDWITKRGHKVPETEAEKQSFQDLRNEQREFHSERQAKKDADELAKATADAKADVTSDDDDDDLDDEEKRLKKIEDDLASERTTRQQSEFYISNKVTPEQGKAILDVMKEKFAAPSSPEGKKRAFELWSTPEALPDLLDLAKARLAKAASSSVAEDAAKAEREKIERESNAKSPGRNATSTQTSDKTEDEARLERFKARYNKT